LIPPDRRPTGRFAYDSKETAIRIRAKLAAVAAALVVPLFVIPAVSAAASSSPTPAAHPAVTPTPGTYLGKYPRPLIKGATKPWQYAPPETPALAPALTPTKSNAVQPDTACTAACYAYSSGYPAGSPDGATSGSVQMSVQQEGTDEPDELNPTGDHSLGDFVIAGTGAEDPLLELTVSTGSEYCHAEWEPCFMVYTWLNGNWTNETGYVEASGSYGLPDGGWHPALGSTFDIGYSISYGRVNVTLNGNIVGYVPQSYWGSVTGWGSIDEEQVASEAYNIQAKWTTPIPSMQYTFDNFEDNLGNTLVLCCTTTPYESEGLVGGGWVVTGGQSPTFTSWWPMQSSDDNGYCVTNNGSTTSGYGLEINACNSEGRDNWEYLTSTDQIENYTSGMCLEDPGDSQVGGTQVEQVTCSSSNTGQVWHVKVVGSNDYFELRDSKSTMCLSNPTNSTTTGDPIKVETCDATPGESQEWDWEAGLTPAT
jgi:hypothetical protein